MVYLVNLDMLGSYDSRGAVYAMGTFKGLAGTAAVVAVDVDRLADALAPAGPPAEHGRYARTVDQAGQRVVEVQREDERAVDMASGEIAGDACVVVAALGEQQHEL